MPTPWRFWIDVGGTFTDCVARTPDGRVLVRKILSSGVFKGAAGAGSGPGRVLDPGLRSAPDGYFEGFRLSLVGASAVVSSFDREAGALTLERPLAAAPEPGAGFELRSPEEAPVAGIRWLMGLGARGHAGPVELCLGTTRGTNALLERRGAPTAFVTTAGFGDVLEIAYQNRPELFELDIRKPAPLATEVLEADERVDASGRVLRPLDEAGVREGLARLAERGIRSLAVCLLNSYRNPAHESRIRELAAELGFRQVSVSSELVPLQRIVARGDTTAADAYLTPVLRDYIDSIRASLPEASIRLMTSAGGLVSPEAFVGKDSVFSGPAGGVVGCSSAGAQAGCGRVIGFDMGGTSTDVCRFDGEFERRYEMEIRGVRVAAPMLRIETVAAGGGSVCRFDGQLPRVGPASAGADPGPACYGSGGPLTLTDANLFLGRLPPDRFAFRLDREAVRRRLDGILAEMRAAGQSYAPEELAEGFVRIADRTMAEAIRKISVARGCDPRDYTMVSFGGAGSQHACAVARELGIRRVLAHPYAGVLSAYGMAVADVRRFREASVGFLYGPESLGAVRKLFARMEEELRTDMAAEGVGDRDVEPPRRLLDLRYQGQDWTMTVPEPGDGDYASAFGRLHRTRYGFEYPGRGLEVAAARMEMTGRREKLESHARPVRKRTPEPSSRTRAWFDGSWHPVEVYGRESLEPGDRILGPAIVLEGESTIVVAPGWRAEMDRFGNLLLEDSKAPGAEEGGAALDLVRLELFNRMFASVAEEAGVALQRTALSTNVKERLDFSCAVFTAEGSLVANAPHIPVHLGAMEECVRHILRAFPRMRPGDAYITNDPFRGGSHLPDVTVVTPVFDEDGRELLFFTASRAHHAEIGGKEPGSLPPFAKNLAEEGVLIRPFRLVADDRSSEEELERLLRDGPYPSRSPADNLADIRAQLAANRRGAERLLTMTRRYGTGVVKAYMGHIQRAASRMMQQALRRFEPGEYRFEDGLDDGSRIRVRVIVEHRAEDEAAAVVDFAGTDGVAANSLNATPAVVRSAVLYSLRCLITEDIPLNSGVLDPVRIVVPEGSLLHPAQEEDPARCPAVGGGNVETSQRIVDVVLGALRVAAASQGTMNNVLFGRSDRAGFCYYETIGGGAGAGPDYEGAHAVHTHMTNTRLTDPEVLEDRYPVRLVRFTVRRGSGGKGRKRGGDGIIREFEFLEPLRVSLLTSRRETRPYGLDGGSPGAAGRNRIRRKGRGDYEDLPWAAELDVGPEDRLLIETPGGGGCGRI